ncbi:MAG: anaerobic ribonucleoside-triphosphate reductase activating protein [bacterium]|nr:anaerobic ribonucleoside-triphosphate reductase activating protein [bacterium]
MTIGGFQKLSLVDYPGKVCSIIFTQGCNFRCPYCHNPELVEVKKEGAVPAEEILEYLGAKSWLLDGVCITGGEPTLQGDLPSFIRKIKDIGLLVKLDTNGSNPTMVRELIGKNLVDYIAMDLKHPWARYGDVAHSPNRAATENCKKTFELIQSSGVDHEFRTTVFPQLQCEEDLFEMAGYIKEGEKYFLQSLRYQKTLDERIDTSRTLDVAGIVLRLRELYPKVILEAR